MFLFFGLAYNGASQGYKHTGPVSEPLIFSYQMLRIADKRLNKPLFISRSKSDIVRLLLWEVPPERVTFMEELGRGAFGKVHKGALKELPKAEVFFSRREQRVDLNEGRIVAIKVLLGKESPFSSIF